MRKQHDEVEQKSKNCSIDELYDNLLEEESIRKSRLKEKSRKSPAKDSEERSFLDVYISPFVSNNRKYTEIQSSTKQNYLDSNMQKATVKKQSDLINKKEQKKGFYEHIQQQGGYLEAIIQKQRKVIEDLKAEVRFLLTKINLECIQNRQNAKTSYEFTIGKDLILYHKLEEQKKKQQKEFLQKNNIDLYMHLSEQKNQREILQKLLEKEKLDNQKLKKDLYHCQQEVKKLMIINEQMLRNTQEYLLRGKKQISMFRKMKAVFDDRILVDNIITQERLNAQKQDKSLPNSARRKGNKTVDLYELHLKQSHSKKKIDFN